MSINCPLLLPKLVITDNARLAAQLSCVLSRRGAYLPVLEGPRMGRPDSDAEIARRNNAASRIKPEAIFLGGLPDETVAAITSGFTAHHISLLKCIAREENLPRLPSEPSGLPPLNWGRDRLGIGLLKALRAGTGIAFSRLCFSHRKRVHKIRASRRLRRR
jgi:hypothetical protein